MFPLVMAGYRKYYQKKKKYKTQTNYVKFLTSAACATALTLHFIVAETILSAIVGVTVGAAVVDTATAVSPFELLRRLRKLALRTGQNVHLNKE